MFSSVGFLIFFSIRRRKKTKTKKPNEQKTTQIKTNNKKTPQQDQGKENSEGRTTRT